VLQSFRGSKHQHSPPTTLKISRRPRPKRHPHRGTRSQFPDGSLDESAHFSHVPRWNQEHDAPYVRMILKFRKKRHQSGHSATTWILIGTKPTEPSRFWTTTQTRRGWNTRRSDLRPERDRLSSSTPLTPPPSFLWAFTRFVQFLHVSVLERDRTCRSGRR